MPRYFFHFRDGKLSEDRDALVDLEAARTKAQRIARELARGGESKSASIVVTDGRQVLFEIDLRDY